MDLLPELSKEIQRLVSKTCQNVTEAMRETNARGSHYFNIIGSHRPSQVSGRPSGLRLYMRLILHQRPERSSWETQNQEAVDEFYSADSAIKHLT